MHTLYNPDHLSDDTLVDDGLLVRIKRQSKVLAVRELPALALAWLESSQDQFKPGRIVGNFVIVNAKTPKIIEPKLDPPIEVHITYDAADIARLKKAFAAYRTADRDALSDRQAPRASVGYWDKTHWVLFTAKDHQLRWEPQEPTATNGVTEAIAIVQITIWPDPPIAAGPP